MHLFRFLANQSINQSINSYKGEKIGEHNIHRELKWIAWMLLDILMPQYRQQSLRNWEDSWFDKNQTKNQQNQDHLYIFLADMLVWRWTDFILMYVRYIFSNIFSNISPISVTAFTKWTWYTYKPNEPLHWREHSFTPL